MPRKRARYRLIDSKRSVAILCAIIVVAAIIVSLAFFRVSTTNSSNCQVEISVSPSSGGSVSSASDFSCISGGTPQSLAVKATANPGYEFQSWTVSGGYIDCETCASTNLWADSGTTVIQMTATFTPN